MWLPNAISRASSRSSSHSSRVSSSISSRSTIACSSARSSLRFPVRCRRASMLRRIAAPQARRCLIVISHLTSTCLSTTAKKPVTRPILVPCLWGEPASVTQYRQPRVTRNREPSNLWPHAASKVPLCYGGVSFRKVSAKRKASGRRRDQASVSITHTVSAIVRIRLWERPRATGSIQCQRRAAVDSATGSETVQLSAPPFLCSLTQRRV